MPTRPKKIVICMDGTGNQLGASQPTNVAKIFKMLDLTMPTEQIAYYDPGVGTMAAPTARGPAGRSISRLSGLAFGSGMKANLTQAYTYLMQHWQPSDSIYIFGFSRGAYTARALAGMLVRPGLLRPGSENLVPYAVAKYAISRDFRADEYAKMAEFSSAFCWQSDGEPLFSQVKNNDPQQIWKFAVPVSYLGIWDTVKASGFLRFGDLRWPYTKSLPNVYRIRHAISIDEQRRPYRMYPVVPKNPRPDSLQQVWFAGVHSDVGGTFGPDHKLAVIALKWVVEGVQSELRFRSGGYQRACRLDNSFAEGAVHQPSRLWRLVGRKRRDLPAGSWLHQSVQVRRGKFASYLPNLPAGTVWADGRWSEPIS